MLVDDIVTKTISAIDLKPVLPRIAAAQKFVLGPEFAAVAEALADDYSGLVRVFDKCRLPYREMWVEWLQADRPRFMSAGIQLPGYQKQPKRVGMLLSATCPELSAWKAHLFWNFEDGECGAAIGAMVCDLVKPFHHLSAADELTMQQVRDDRARILRSRITPHPGWTSASLDVRLAMTNHTGMEHPDFDVSFLGKSLLATISPAERRKAFQVMIELAQSDWAGEVPYMLAVIGLLNARNATETDHVDRTKINKTRKKDGKPLLFEHKILRIAGRQTKHYVNGDGSATHATRRAHWTRGHFKHRKTGIFFWHPHLRGNLQRGLVDKDYELV
jgi:hypothetical protein